MITRAVFVCLFLAIIVTTPVLGQEVLVVDGGTLIDGTSKEPVAGQRIIIVDGVIESVSASTPIPKGATIVDASGKFIVPGLSDMHVHFSLGLPQPRITRETEIVLNRLLYYGVTSILNMGASDGSSEAINTYRKEIDEGIRIGPTIYATGGHINIPGTHPIETIFPPRVREFAAKMLSSTPLDSPADLYPIGIGISLVRTTEAAKVAVRERADAGMDAIKITIERGPTEFGNHHPIMPDSIITAIVNEASIFDLPVFAHVSSLEELESALRCGVSGIVHAVAEPPYPQPAFIDTLAARGFYVMPTLALYESFIQYLEDERRLEDPFLRESVTVEEISIFRRAGFLDRAPVDSLITWRQSNQQTIGSIGQMHQNGVRIVAGTDVGNPMVFAGWSIHQEMEKLVEAGMSTSEALQSATSTAAAMIGKDREYGTIEPGKRGDLLILNGNPLDDITNLSEINMVIAAGRQIDRASLEISF